MTRNHHIFKKQNKQTNKQERKMLPAFAEEGDDFDDIRRFLVLASFFQPSGVLAMLIHRMYYNVIVFCPDLVLMD